MTETKRDAPPKRAAEIKTQNSERTLFLNGKPIAPALRDVKAGNKIKTAGNPGLYRLRNVGLGWTASQSFDYSEMDARAEALLAADSDAHFLLEINVDAPDWWLAANPAEQAAFCLPPVEGKPSKDAASWASAKWRNETNRALMQLVRHVKNAKWSERAVGYQIAAGEGGAWRHPQADRLPDIGPRMTERFVQFAQTKYRRNEGVLRKEWFDAKIQFQRITCPTARDRDQAFYGAFRNPLRSRRLLDYYECFATAQNDAALLFSETVKKTTEGAALVGLAYAAFSGGDSPAEDGTLYPDAVLDSADVDFFIKPEPLEKFPFLPLASLSLRGKYVFNAEKNPIPGKSFVPADFGIVADFAALSYLRPAERWAADAALSGQLRELERGGVAYDLYALADVFHDKLPNHKVWIFPNAYYLSEAERRRIDARFKRSEQTAVFLWGVGLCGETGINAEFGQRLCSQKLRVESNESNLRVRHASEKDPIMADQRPKAHFGMERAAAPTVTVSDKSTVRLGANADNKTNFAVMRFPQWTSVYCGAAPLPASIAKNLVVVEPAPEKSDSQSANKNAQDAAIGGEDAAENLREASETLQDAASAVPAKGKKRRKVVLEEE